MKVLSLHQPWASLVALGVKTIETRSWRAPASLIGERFAVHAATTPLPVGGHRLPAKYTYTDKDREGWLAINTITDPAFQGPQPCNPVTGRQRHIPRPAQTPTLMWPHAGPHHRPREGKPEFTHIEYLPLGAIVATARLVDCVPMIDGGPVRAPAGCVIDRMELRYWPTGGWNERDGNWRVIEDQRPYGDFRPGRWAWILTDIEPLEPVPFKGGQGLSRSWDGVS